MAVNTQLINERASGEDILKAFTGTGDVTGFFETLTQSLEGLRTDIKAGDLTITEFFERAPDIAQVATQQINQFATTGAEGANLAAGFRTRLQKFIQFGGEGGPLGGSFVDVKAPFTSREFSTLPKEVLPSIDQINRGEIPVDLLPPGAFERVQREVREPTDAALPTPGAPGVPGAPGAPGIPSIGDVPTTVPQTPDQAIIEAEARRQEEQQRRGIEATRGLREQGLGQLEQLLGTQRERQFEEFVPQAADILQTRGLLQTSELETTLGEEAGRLQGLSEDIISRARIGGTQQDITSLNELIARRQQLQGTGLQRRFSLQDFERQARLAQQLGAQAAPQVSGGGKGGVSGALTQVGIGAAGSFLGGAGGAAGANLFK